MLAITKASVKDGKIVLRGLINSGTIKLFTVEPLAFNVYLAHVILSIINYNIKVTMLCAEVLKVGDKL